MHSNVYGINEEIMTKHDKYTLARLAILAMSSAPAEAVATVPPIHQLGHRVTAPWWSNRQRLVDAAAGWPSRPPQQMALGSSPMTKTLASNFKSHRFPPL